MRGPRKPATCDGCGAPSTRLERLPNGTLAAWRVCPACVAEDVTGDVWDAVAHTPLAGVLGGPGVWRGGL